MMNKKESEKTYVLLRGNEELWKSIEAGKSLYFYLDKIDARDLVGFIFDPNKKIIYGKITFDESD